MENIKESELVRIQSLIYEIRGYKVMVDRDLAKLYGVETKVLNQAVKRNIKRFPEDFMFQLTHEECLRSQIVTLNTKQGHHLKYLPYAFTEQGVAMLSSVLRSDAAIEVNIRIMRAFVSIRNQIYAVKHLNSELEIIKAKLELLERNDEDNLEAINDLSEDMRKEIDTIYRLMKKYNCQSDRELLDLIDEKNTEIDDLNKKYDDLKKEYDDYKKTVAETMIPKETGGETND